MSCSRPAVSRWCAALLCALALAGCEPPGKSPFELTDITGADFGKELNLTDHHGKPRTLADFRGKVVAIFFGYTHCPDVCPTVLADFATVAKALGPGADRLQVLFVTVDPERDTQEVLAQYVPHFNASFLGLYGDAEATARAARAFKLYYRKQGGGSNYTVDHGAATYILDPQGRLRLFAHYGASAAALLHDIQLLLAP